LTVPAPLIECVPNFSEGRREAVLAALAASIREVPGVRLLDVSPDPDHNRSVFTLVGRAEAVVEAAYRSAATALRWIDLGTHHGVHPRIGAVDVIPFVPLHDATMEACAALARRLAARLAADFGLPAYLYGAASRNAGRGLATIRRGGFESLRTEIADPVRHPDYGPARVHPTGGAVAVGARGILIAFNVDLASDDLAAARAIAAAVRESSGGLPAVQAMGVPLASRRLVQVSMNLLNYRRTPPLAAYERVGAEAARRGISISAGELIGCAPRDALPPDPVTALRLGSLRPGQILDLEHIARTFSGVDEPPAGAAGRP
jgi:glutamate formiminotransferase